MIPYIDIVGLQNASSADRVSSFMAVLLDAVSWVVMAVDFASERVNLYGADDEACSVYRG